MLPGLVATYEPEALLLMLVVVDATLPRSAGAYGPPELAAAAGLV